jgi:hypothetical protein
MQFSSLPINSSLQNNPRYQFSLKSENIEILPILSAAILKMTAIRMHFSSLPINTVVSNHVNSDHVPSFSCLDVTRRNFG